jgi:hypothetical protein
MSRRSIQRKMWHSVYKNLPPVKRPGLESMSWSEIVVSLLVVSLIVYMFVVK